MLEQTGKAGEMMWFIGDSVVWANSKELIAVWMNRNHVKIDLFCQFRNDFYAT